MIEKIQLMPGVTLRCFRDTRFKQGLLSFQLVRPMDAREAAMNALLPSVLLRGTRRCPDLRAVTQHLDALYGASLSPVVRRVGNCQTTGLGCSFMDDRFALPGDKVMEPALDFLREVLLESPLEEGVFLSSFVESEKKNLIATIESEKNNKGSYAMGQMLRVMCKNDSYGLPRLGEAEQVAAITPQGLYAHYREVLRTSPIQIFYVGSAAPEAVAEQMRRILEGIDRECGEMTPQTDFIPGEPENVTETMEVTQGKLCMGFVTGVTNRSPDVAAMQVLCSLYGGGMTSKLFMNVREKMSLCYSVGAGYYSNKGILFVSAGIDFDKETEAKNEILRQLELCRQGQITEAELTAGKEAIFNSLRITHDSPGAIEGYYANQLISGWLWSPEYYMEQVAKVTLDDVVAVANKVQLHTTYFLKGGSQ